ncbi:hypothetical protein F1C10_11035 [Sphingomonas sp. NBWT7]|uniref:hypothetical protein n=1 Tax=Sphingomonas sp. NBWT7 TaxID=2596913 RepID=UPI0016279D4C|nr:hypothetical protein [Sphingomonas sp. NBWT7]QNE32425.1 hypothetical protein F1C10_11035 [Sphingomonas sp. NBWT7]
MTPMFNVNTFGVAGAPVDATSIQQAFAVPLLASEVGMRGAGSPLAHVTPKRPFHRLYIR